MVNHYQPAVTSLRYELTNSASENTETSHFIDLARDLSIVNRRLYRSGRNYHVKRITVISKNTPNLGSRVAACVIPYSWVSVGAWKRGLRVWNEMNAIASENLAGDITATWHDFKVAMSLDFQSATLARVKDNGSNLYDLGTWDYSQMVTPDGVTGEDPFFLHMLGGHDGTIGNFDSVGLIKSYGESRPTVEDGSPNVPGTASDDPLVNVFDYGTTVDEVVDLLEGDNDLPPYDISEYPGDDTNGPKPIVVSDCTIVDGMAKMPGFNAMLGQIEFEITSPLPSDVYSVLVELSAGKYKGIKSEEF